MDRRIKLGYWVIEWSKKGCYRIYGHSSIQTQFPVRFSIGLCILTHSICCGFCELGLNNINRPMIVLAFDRDWTVDVNPHPRREAVPLEYVKYWAEETEHEVWATGNQLLVEEAEIPGTIESVRRLKGTIEPFGEKDERGRYENWPERETRLKILEKLFPDADQYIVVDDLDLKHVENWDHYYAWTFMENLRDGTLDIEVTTTLESE